MSAVLPKVHLTKILRQALVRDGYDPDVFVEYFAEWKAKGVQAEFDDYYFGKDGFYERPKRSGRRVLRHVHIAPDQPAEGQRPSKALENWDRDWERQSRRTSDNSLIYAEDPGRGFLLIFLAREPLGHQLARMDTPVSAQFMDDLADAADAFIFSGKILL